MSRTVINIIVSAFVIAFGLPLMAQSENEIEQKALIAEQAEAILKAEEGTWNSVWESVNAKGEVFKTVKGVETFEPFNGSVRLVRTRIEGRESESTAFRFYNPTKQKLYIIDVSANGQHFILKQEVGNDTIITEPYLTQRGTMAILRFSTIEKGENWKLIKHEVSHDNGESWRQFRRQRMDKVETPE